MQTSVQLTEKSPYAGGFTTSAQSLHGMKITPEQMAAARIPLQLARWFHCISPRIVRPNLIDELRLSQVATAFGKM